MSDTVWVIVQTHLGDYELGELHDFDEVVQVAKDRFHAEKWIKSEFPRAALLADETCETSVRYHCKRDRADLKAFVMKVWSTD